MIASHETALVVTYAGVLLLVALLQARLRSTWPQAAPESFARPGRALGALLLGCLGVLGVGQLYMAGYLLPERGPWAPGAAALNQLLIFAPALLVVWLRRESPRTLWLGGTRLPARVGIGLALACAALLLYCSVRAGIAPFPVVLLRVLAWEHVDEAVQVLGEDLLIAALFVRLAAVLGSTTRSVVVVALLFVGGHVPALISGGAGARELLGLVRDLGLALAVSALLARSRDVVWFYFVHLALDLTQFEPVTRGA